MRYDIALLAGATLVGVLSANSGAAGDGIVLEGSLVQGGFDRVTNPIFNETPLITTEIRPIYLMVEDCAENAARAAAAGGQVIRPKFSIGKFGWVALCQDTEGNIFGINSMQ